MADIRNVASTALAPQVRPTQRSEAVRSAQRAFFQAALNGAPTAPPSQPHFEAAAATRLSSALDPQAEPSATLRPGSLLDIKV